MLRGWRKRFRRKPESKEEKPEETEAKTHYYKAKVSEDVPRFENEYEQEIAKLTAGEDGMPRYLALDEVRKMERYSCLEGFSYGMPGRLDVQAKSIEDAKKRIVAASKEKFDVKDQKSKIETVLGIRFENLQEVLESVKE